MQGVRHLSMRLFDYTTPGLGAPSPRNLHPYTLASHNFGPQAALYTGYPALPPPMHPFQPPHYQPFLAQAYPVHPPAPPQPPPPPPYVQALPHAASAGPNLGALRRTHALGAHPHARRHSAHPTCGYSGYAWAAACYESDRPLQAGFLRDILLPHLRHLQSLQLLRSSKVLNVEDYRAIGGVTGLTELSICSLVRRLPVYVRACL